VGGRASKAVKPLLDTHILIHWIAGSIPLHKAHRRIIDAASDENPMWVSDITLWEVAALRNLGRVEFDLPLRDWLERATAPPLVRRLAITPAVAAEVAALPDTFHRDPADRIIVATARVTGATILTRDDRIRDSGLAPVA
jgi:PIN domain nuclease of toxin-antitoxin system